jgi:topoisomerase-4 subunit A
VALPADGSGHIASGSSDGRLLVFPVAEVKTLAAGGKGVMLIVLEDGQTMTSTRLLADLSAGINGTLDVAGKGNVPFALKGADFEKHVGHRARKGCQLPKKGVLR